MVNNPAIPTIEAFGTSFRAAKTTSVEVTEACLRQIAAENSRLNAFILVMADEARAQAARLDEELAAGIDRGPLHGVPISVKDLIDVRGTATTAASRVREGHIAARDATVIGHLRRAGAVLIGKTNLHEFAFGTTNEESSAGPVRNPHDPARSPGGSSGGSAVSVATGMALASVGTDTGGSIRIPAAACGVVGLKPGAGEVSTDGVVPLSDTLDHVGPLAQTVMDGWLVYRALIGDRRRHTNLIETGTAAHGLRLAVPRRYFCEVLDEEVRVRFEEALERLRKAGARVEDADIGHASDIMAVYLPIVFSDAAAYHAATLETMPERYSEKVRSQLEAGRYLLAEDMARALKGRRILRREVDATLDGIDALVLPTLPIPAPMLGAVSMVIAGVTEPVRNLMLRQTQLFNLTGHPAISLPCGTTSAGLPCGLQMVGARTRTRDLIASALKCEAALKTAGP